MPELPEIESIRRSLSPIITGRALHVAQVGRHDMRARGEGRGSGRPRRWMEPRMLLDGAEVARLERRGKRLAIVATDGRVLVVQLGMSGQLACGPGIARSHRHVTWNVAGRRDPLVFRDPRRFGGVTAYRSVADVHAAWDAALGPDALRVTERALARALGGTRPVKCALLDQATIAGVGNIYADESLHRAGIDPRTRCDVLGSHDIRHLARAIRSTLRDAIAHGGSTLRDHRTGTGRHGQAQLLHAVYGRAGMPCLRCGTPLRGIRLGGRATCWCPTCQRSLGKH